MPLQEAEVHGYCDARRRAELLLLARRSPNELAAAPGDFVLVLRQSDSTLLISSRSGLASYFYAPQPLPGGGFAHGPDVASVLARSGGARDWDHVAVADYLAFGHPLGAATVAAGVARVPPGAVVTLPHNDDTPNVESFSPLQAKTPIGPGIAGETLCRVVARTDPDAALSLSGGLDSRLLLAALLACGRRPHLLVSGAKGSFDRAVGESIAQRFDLPLSVHEVTADDVVAVAHDTALASNGLLPATNAAGVAHLRALANRIEGAPVFIGYLGESARSYYTDRSLPIALRALVRGRGEASRLICTHAQLGLTEDEFEQASPKLAAALAPSAVFDRLNAALRGLPGRNALDLSDGFFVRQHGPQKVATELAAVGHFVSPRAPFGDPAWIEAARLLPRRWKLGDRLHRHLIGNLCPDLLTFADELYGARTPRFPPAAAFVRKPRPRRRFYLRQEIFRSGPLQRAAGKCGSNLTGLVPPELLCKISREQANSGERPHALFALASLAAWSRASGVLPTSDHQ